MAKDNGGIIGVLNTPTSTSASGVWQLMSEYQARLSGTWPSPFNVGSSSARFNSGSTDYLNKNFASTATSEYISTISFWIKRAKISSSQYVFGCYGGSPSVYSTDLVFTANDTLEFSFGNTSAPLLETSQVFRDVSAWYHIVYAVDTTQATSSNRVKLYVNGSQVTAFGTASYPAQNAVFKAFKNNNANLIGSSWNGGSPINMYLSEFYNIDGQALTPSSFGQTDSTTGIWIPKAYTGTYGTNGFYLNFSNAASLGTDASGNGNNFTVNNLTSVDQSKDHPTNNWCVGNPLFRTGIYSNTVWTEGNLASGNAGIGNVNTSGECNFRMSAGKWYWEIKMGNGAVSGASMGIWTDGYHAPADTGCVFYQNDGNKSINGSSSSYGATFIEGDILGFAYDADAGTLVCYKNGTSQGTMFSAGAGGTYVPAFARGNNPTTYTDQWNFGQPMYTVSGGYSDASGYGNFTYQPPSGFLALCTNNLASNG